MVIRKLGFSVSFNVKNTSWNEGETPIGYDYVELVAGYQANENDEVRKKTLKQYTNDFDHAHRDKLKVWSIHLPYGKDLDLSADSHRSNEILNNFAWYIDNTISMGPAYYVVHSSMEPIDIKDREKLLNNARNNIERLADYITDKGATLAVECLPRTCLGNTSSECLQLILGTKAVLCFDVNHMLLQNHGDFMKKVHKYVKTVHLSDYDFMDEKHWIPGDGQLNWTELMHLLDEYGYKGPMIFEVKTNKVGSQISLAELRDSFYKAIENGGEQLC